MEAQVAIVFIHIPLFRKNLVFRGEYADVASTWMLCQHTITHRVPYGINGSKCNLAHNNLNVQLTKPICCAVQHICRNWKVHKAYAIRILKDFRQLLLAICTPPPQYTGRRLRCFRTRGSLTQKSLDPCSDFTSLQTHLQTYNRQKGAFLARMQLKWTASRHLV